MIRIDGGYLILNFIKYRERDYTAAERSKRYRERKASHAVALSRHDVTSRAVTQAEAEAETDPTAVPQPPPKERAPAPEAARAHGYERPTISEFVSYMVKEAGISEDYARDRWGRLDSKDWVDGNGAIIKRWRSLAPSLQTQFRNDSATPPRGKASYTPDAKKSAPDPDWLAFIRQRESEFPERQYDKVNWTPATAPVDVRADYKNWKAGKT